MQLLRTDVNHVTGPKGQPILQVSFCGEGGDCVTVDMTSVDLPDDASAIERARAILVQTATFNLAANDYDARSNGSFDELSVTTASAGTDQVYIFEYRDGDGGRQVPPCTMPSFDAAREEAIRSAVDLLPDLQPGTDDLTGWLVRIRDANGELLCTIDVAEAQANLEVGQ